MNLVIDGLAARGTSIAVVIEHTLRAWTGTGDELHLVLGTGSSVSVPDHVIAHEVELGTRAYTNRLRAQATLLPRLCRTVRADALLAAIPATTVNPLPCPRAVIAHDIRHELRPAQFGVRARWLRRASHGIGFRQADAIITVSERTRRDLMTSRPWLEDRIVRVARLGSDHVADWPRRDPDVPYAITFGQWGNKNVGLVIDAWAALATRGEAMPLSILGLSATARGTFERQVAERGLGDLITLLPWLTDEDFRTTFASAALVVFPSDFEGFGLPAVEAMRLGIPLVISPDAALLEVTGGHAAVMADFGTDALVRAVRAARRTPAETIERARTHVAPLTWEQTAGAMRATLCESIDRRPAG